MNYMDHINPEQTENFAKDPKTTFLFPTNDKCAVVNSDFVNSHNKGSPLYQWPARNTGSAGRAKLHDVKMLRRSTASYHTRDLMKCCTQTTSGCARARVS